VPFPLSAVQCFVASIGSFEEADAATKVLHPVSKIRDANTEIKVNRFIVIFLS
jgi:hypothetical protein